ncbi:hypothetical protein QY95_03517 [Bacillus thermotolerans]|uniref:Uncharacterized protein n=1 Tax=Bacillus thermotolerans TaxID=1221996 RepID=A0A0F5HQ47_BACTR|nr:hypothetical protein QY95_03517 [Bacillus thermotolerans]
MLQNKKNRLALQRIGLASFRVILFGEARRAMHEFAPFFYKIFVIWS